MVWHLGPNDIAIPHGSNGIVWQNLRWHIFLKNLRKNLCNTILSSFFCHYYTLFLEWHSTTQTLTTRTHTHPYEYTYANPTPMSTSEGLSTGRSGDSRNHQWRLVVDGNVAYHLTHNAGKSWKNPGKGASTRIWTLVGSVPLDCPTIGLQAQSLVTVVA
jgi:hypothetical protein